MTAPTREEILRLVVQYGLAKVAAAISNAKSAEHYARMNDLYKQIEAALPAAPSGETAPQCGHTIAGVLGRVLTCSRPAGHGGDHGDASGAQWGLVPAGVEVAAASVPAAPNAQATTADVDRIVRALVNDHGWTCRRDLREIVTATLQLAAAPSGEQPTTEPADTWTVPRVPHEPGWVDGDRVNVMTPGTDTMTPTEAREFAAWYLAAADEADRPTTEPAGEVDR